MSGGNGPRIRAGPAGTGPGDRGILRDVLPFVAVLAAIIAVLLATTFVYVRLSDGLRGYVNGESRWTKAQKDAVFHLDEYAASGDPSELEEFREALRVPLSDRRARELLLAPELDREAVRDALLEGGVPEADVAEMIMAVRWFRGVDPVRRALETWAEGDAVIADLQELAGRTRSAVQESGPGSPEAIALAEELDALDRRATVLETRFATILARMDRALSRGFLILLSGLGALLLLLGGWVAWTLLARVRASEAAARERDQRLRMVAWATNDVIWDLDPETGAIEWSRALHETFGYDPSTVDGGLEWWAERVHPDDRERVVETLDHRLRSEENVFASEYRFRRADGSYAPVYDRGYVQRDGEGRPVRMIGSMLDLTENREIERALRRTEVRYQELLEQASDTILILEPDLTIDLVNDEAIRILGFDREELLGRNAREFIADRSLEEKPLRMEAVRAGETVVMERDMVAKDGSRIPMEFSTRQLEDGRVQTIGRDVRERRELETRLRQSQKMEAVGRLAGGVAHDFNNLLTAIRGHTQILLMELDEEDPAYEDVKGADRAAERAAALVSQLLTFSRRQSADPRLLGVNARIRETEDMLRRLSGDRVRVHVDLSPDAGRVRMDPVQFEQVLLNLLVNAVDALPDGGTVLLQTRRVGGGGPRSRSGEAAGASTGEGTEPSEWVRIRVRDDGAGMSPETVERIFEPFYTEKEAGEGTGLGLATVYAVVEEAGGEIEVESELGVGSTFDVLLPRVPGRPAEDA